MTARRPAGHTLLEVIVVVAVLGALALVPQLGARFRRQTTPPETPMERLRRDAIRAGSARTLIAAVDGRPVLVTALPDGRVLHTRAESDAR